MPRYIDADALMEQMEIACMGVMSGCDPFNEPLKVLESAPTTDVVEIITNELTNKISERIIQFLEENYEIIPKKPLVRCKECKYWETVGACVAKFCTRIVNTEIMKYEDDYCSLGERRE